MVVTWSLINWSALCGGNLLSSLNAVISTNESTWIYKGSYDFKLPYDFSYKMKKTQGVLDSTYIEIRNSTDSLFSAKSN